jgi:hypothetical protein
VETWHCTTSNERWEGLEGEDAHVHMRRLAREGEELREMPRRHELGEEGTKDSTNTSDFMDDTYGRASIYIFGSTIDTEVLRIGPHWLLAFRRCKEKHRLIAEREAGRRNDECVSARLRPRLAYATQSDR